MGRKPESLSAGSGALPAAPAFPALCDAASGGAGGGPASGAICSAIELSEDGKAPKWIQVFPKGPELRTVSYDSRGWTLSDPAAVAAASTADGLKLPIDWEHAQARRAPKGERVPTAGWIRRIELRGGVLMGRVEWTAAGRASVESREYLYFSPVFIPGKAGSDVRQVLQGALVKNPAFAMPELAPGQAGGQMEEFLKKIAAALGLAEGATEEEALAKAEALVSERDGAVALAAAPPIDKFVPRADYDAATARAATAERRLADARKSERDKKIKRLLDEAQEDGKITPATREYHAAQCAAEGGIKRFKEFLAAAPEVAGASGAGSTPPGGAATTAAERKVARMMGLPEDFARNPGGDG